MTHVNKNTINMRLSRETLGQGVILAPTKDL